MAIEMCLFLLLRRFVTFSNNIYSLCASVELIDEETRDVGTNWMTNTTNVQRLKKKVFFFGNWDSSLELISLFFFHFLFYFFLFVHFILLGCIWLNHRKLAARAHQSILYINVSVEFQWKMFYISILLFIISRFLINPIKNKILLFELKTDLPSCPWIFRPKKYQFRWWHLIHPIQWTFRQKFRRTTCWISNHRSGPWIGLGRLFIDSCQEFLHRSSN